MIVDLKYFRTALLVGRVAITLIMIATTLGVAAQEETAEQREARLLDLANGDPHDLIYLRNQTRPMKVEPNLPRPFRRQTIPGGKVTATKLNSNARVTLGVDLIARVELFEERLMAAGRESLERKDFDIAFELLARLVRMNPKWPDGKKLLYSVFARRAELALNQNPPDYDAAISLSLQLRSEDRENAEVRTLMRTACLGKTRANLAVDDYALAWESLNTFLSEFPLDPEARELRNGIEDLARDFISQAQKLSDGTLQEQRQAVELLMKARRVWLKAPNLDKMLVKARRNYPIVEIAIFDRPRILEPLGAETLTEWQACQLLFGNITELDGSGRQFYHGDIIEDWSQKALGRKHEITLRKGHYWSDGKPVTAFDIEWSMELWTDPRATNYDPERARYIGQINVQDPFHLTIELSRAHPRPLSLFSVPILPKHVLPTPPPADSKFSRRPIGSGPYRVTNPDSTEQNKFVVNSEFHGHSAGQPFVKEINFEEYVKSSAALTGLKNNKVHLMTELDPLQVIELSNRSSQFEVRNYLANSVYMLAINHRKDTLNELAVRRAMLLAIDRTAILNQYFHASRGGLAHRVISGPFPTQCPGYDRSARVRSPDRSLATQLLTSTKQELTNRTISLKYPLGDIFVSQAVIQMKKDLEAIGLKIRAEAKIPADLYNEVVKQNDFDLVYWRYDHRNILYNIASLFDADAIDAGETNFMGYRNPQLVQLFGELRREPRALEVWRIQQEIHRLVYDEVTFIPLWQLDNYIAHTSRLLYRPDQSERLISGGSRQLPIHPFYLFRKTEGWHLKPL